MSKMPIQKPGKSEQVVGTPTEFLDAVEKRLYIPNFVIDLAASPENKIRGAEHFYSEADDSLKQRWAFEGWGWCNPPFGHIEPWVMKGWYESRLGAHTAMLLPAGVGSNWWRDWVHEKAHVLFLNGRLTFVGHTNTYPKDLVLLLYTPAIQGGYEAWNWREI